MGYKLVFFSLIFCTALFSFYIYETNCPSFVDPFWYGTGEIDESANVSQIILELGSQVNVTSNLTGNFGVVCVDIDHPDYGENYSCGNPNAEFLFNVTYFRKSELNDSSIIKNLSWIDGGNETVYIKSHQYDEVVNLTLNLTGFESDGTLPIIKVYINDTLDKSLGAISAGVANLTTFNDSSNFYNFSVTEVGTQTAYIELPIGANVTNSTLNVSGFSSGLDSKQVYDNIDDSSINTTLWTTTTSCSGVCTGGGGSATVTEDTSKIEGLADSEHSQSGTSITTVSLESIYSPPSLNNLENITLRVINTASSGSSTDCVSTTYFKVFGANIITKTCSNQVSCTESNDSVWTVVRNESAGLNKYDVFSGGVYFKQITATENKLFFYATSTVPIEGVSCSAEFEVYYYNYTTIDAPEDISFAVGSEENIVFNRSGEYVSDEQTVNFAGEINAYLASCTANVNGFCPVPLYLTASPTGVIKFYNLLASYTSDINPVVLNYSLVQDFLDDSNGYADIPLVFQATTNGTLQLSDIRYDYAGGNDTINATVHAFLEYDNIILYYQFDEDNDTVAVDNSSSLNNGVFDGDLDNVEGGYLGRGIYFDGTNDNLTTTDSITFNNQSGLTFMSFLYSNGSNEKPIAVIGAEDDGGFIIIESVGDIVLISETDSYESLETPGSIIQDGEWYHVAVTWDGNDNFSIYVNGTIQASGDINPMDNWTGKVTIGRESAAYFSTHSWNGTMDEVVILNKTLTPGDISSIYDKYNDDSETLYRKETAPLFLLYYSDWFYNFPSFVDFLEFIPSKFTSKNVTPFGQTINVPFLNITTSNYGGKNLNLTVHLNETHECVNLSLSLDNNKSNSFLLTDNNWTDIDTDLEYQNNTQVWMWADYDCDYTNWNLWYPQLDFRGCCVDCICSEDII